MAEKSVSRVSTRTDPSRVPPAGGDPAGVNHARYLVVLALGAFALPAAARVTEALGAPRTPAGVSALLLAVVLIVAILAGRPRADDAGPAPVRAAGGEEPGAGV